MLKHATPHDATALMPYQDLRGLVKLPLDLGDLVRLGGVLVVLDGLGQGRVHDGLLPALSRPPTAKTHPPEHRSTHTHATVWKETSRMGMPRIV